MAALSVAATGLAAAPTADATGTASRGAAVAGTRPPRPAPIWPQPGAAVPAVPRISWHTCEEPDQRRLHLQCATVRVPLDHARPQGPTITLDLARHRATSRRKGSVMVNPGGPGGTPTTSMGRFLEVLGPQVARSFDIVAMDPRGVGESSRLHCWSKAAEPDGAPPVPTTAPEIRRAIAHDAFERKACAATGRPIMDHMSTGDVARDMDLVRQALGDRSIGYYGVSYGTVLGATYAAMFPRSVRAMVLDGVVDPVEWTTGRGKEGATVPVSARGGSGAGADETLRAAFAACRAAGPRRCAPGRTIQAEWDATVARLRRGPVTVAGQQVRLGDVLDATLPSLYDPETYPAMIDYVHQTYLAVVKGAKKPPAPVGTRRGPGTPGLGVPPGGPTAPTRPMPDDAKWWDGFTQAGVMCSDAVNPRDPAAWPRHAAATARSSWFTPVWTWNSSLCAGWPGRSTGAYRGPFTGRPAHPLLVVGNTHDPATPLASAQAVTRRSPGARLVTVDAFGHTAGTQSRCASAVMRRYLLTGALPAKDVRCRADKPIL